MKRIAGSVELGEGFSEDWERASLERSGVEKAEIDRIAPAVASEMVGPRILAVEIAVEVSMMVGIDSGYASSPGWSETQGACEAILWSNYGCKGLVLRFRSFVLSNNP